MIPTQVRCPNPECKEGHISTESCSCPVQKYWDDDHGWDGYVIHDRYTCETICPCCLGREEVDQDDAEDWVAKWLREE